MWRESDLRHGYDRYRRRGHDRFGGRFHGLRIDFCDRDSDRDDGNGLLEVRGHDQRRGGQYLKLVPGIGFLPEADGGLFVQLSERLHKRGNPCEPLLHLL